MTPPTPDTDPIQAAARNLKILLGFLLERAEEAATQSEEIRTVLGQNVRDLLASRGSTPPGEILEKLVHETQALFPGEDRVTIGSRQRCAGEEGLGVTATKAATNAEDEFTVTACVTGSLEDEPITGGGLEMLFAYHG